MSGEKADSAIIEAAGILLMTQDIPKRFLLLEHKDRLDLPKGHAEPGESLLQTALREAEEETGIAASQIVIEGPFRFVTEYRVASSKRGAYDKRVTYYLGYVQAAQEIKLTEHIGYRWQIWNPGRPIQTQTIDPLVAAIAEYLDQNQL